MRFILLSLFLIGCATPNISVINNGTVEKVEVFEAKKYVVKPGEVVRIDFPRNEFTEDGRLECGNRSIPFFEKNGRFHAFVAETYHSNFKPITCVVEKNQTTLEVAKLSVATKDFPSERLNVDQRRVELNAKDLKRVQKEQVFLNKNYSSSPDHPFFDEPFVLPIGNVVTSIYGSRRVFNNLKQTQHLGTDYRAAIGEEIFSANSGKIVVARDLFFTGKTVTIDHGLGLFTIYGHLSKIDVSEGEYVPRGKRIGLSGATGRVTGPHLHWGVRVNGHFIEGDSLIRESNF